MLQGFHQEPRAIKLEQGGICGKNDEAKMGYEAYFSGGCCASIVPQYYTNLEYREAVLFARIAQIGFMGIKGQQYT